MPKKRKPSFGMLGKHHSEEWKKNLSERMKGNKYVLGYKHTEKWKKEMSAKMKGKKRTKEFGEKQRKNHSGEKCNFWKGGITLLRGKIYNSQEYKNWRLSVFERDKFICQMPDCNKMERYLEAHHIKTFADNPKLRFFIDNGITLCKGCHLKTKTKEKLFESLFNEIIRLKHRL